MIFSASTPTPKEPYPVEDKSLVCVYYFGAHTADPVEAASSDEHLGGDMFRPPEMAARAVEADNVRFVFTLMKERSLVRERSHATFGTAWKSKLVFQEYHVQTGVINCPVPPDMKELPTYISITNKESLCTKDKTNALVLNKGNQNGMIFFLQTLH